MVVLRGRDVDPTHGTIVTQPFPVWLDDAAPGEGVRWDMATWWAVAMAMC